MSEQVQNYQNHVRNDPKIYAALAISLVSLIMAVAAIFNGSVTLLAGSVALMGVNSILLGFIARTYSVSLQDRIIKTEMRLRLAGLLDGDLAARIPEFTVKQLIGMRFESDEHLPELARKVLDEDLQSAKEIKQQVKDWQADWHRV